MQTSLNKTELALLLNQVPGLGDFLIRRILTYYESFDQFKKVSARHLEAIDGIGKVRAADLTSFEFDREAIDEEFRFLDRIKGEIIPFWSDDYPSRLKNLDGMPLLLYWCGNKSALESDSIAVVGTRKPTQYGITAADFFTRDLVNAGLTIVSGFARGIDTIAHQTAIKEGGTTIAVMGSGFKHIYPSENKSLIPKLIENGGILSEYSPFTLPDPGHFPDRNRIISGLSYGTLVVEAAESGGALITAAYALEQNKEVFAVPGEVFQDRSKGTNRLILNGQAKLVLSAQDILAELPGFSVNQKEKISLPELSLFEEKIYNALGGEPIHIDVLAEKCEMKTSELLIHLLTLEFKALVRQIPGKYFMKY